MFGVFWKPIRRSSMPMWETTFARLTHTGLGKPINEYSMPPSMQDTSSSHRPIRSGYVSQMLFPHMDQCITHVCLCVVCFVCKPILAMIFLQRKRLIARLARIITHVWHCLLCLVCFVDPSLQYCYKENVRRSSMHHAFLTLFFVLCRTILAVTIINA